MTSGERDELIPKRSFIRDVQTFGGWGASKISDKTSLRMDETIQMSRQEGLGIQIFLRRPL